MRTVDGCVLCAARCLKNQCQLWGCRNSCCSVVRGGFRAPTEGVEGHGRALLTQAEGRVHCTVTQVRTGGKPRTTAGNLFQGVVCEQNRDLGHGSCKPLDQGHSPLLAARLVHPELWMRMATEMDKALHALAGVSKLLPGLSVKPVKPGTRLSSELRACCQRRFPSVKPSVNLQHLTTSFSVLCVWGVLPCA